MAGEKGRLNSLSPYTRHDSSSAVPYLKRYDINSNLVWSKTSATPRDYRCEGLNGDLIAVGNANADFLIQKWDGDGNLLWLSIYDRRFT
jgi:hypothetical protein